MASPPVRWWRALPTPALPNHCRQRWPPGCAGLAASSSAAPRARRACCTRPSPPAARRRRRPMCWRARSWRTIAAARRSCPAPARAPPRAPVGRARGSGAPHRSGKEIGPGRAHPLQKPIDPRTPRLFQIAAENGLSGHYVALMQAVQSEAERVSGKSLPINATGAIGAIACEFGFPWRIIRGLGVMARAVGLVGHILEEIDDPMGVEIWQRVEREAGGPRQDG